MRNAIRVNSQKRQIHKLDPKELGYFIILANSRSGHNFTKQNILSWTEDEEIEKWGDSKYRQMIDLENCKPEEFIEINNINFEKWNESILVLQTRDLLNWYGSLTGFKERGIRRKRKNPVKIKKHTLNQVFHQYEVRGNHDFLNKEGDNIVVIADDIDKKEFLQGKVRQQTENKNFTGLVQIYNWYAIAKEFVGETNYLPDFTTKIHYDEFFLSQEYRKKICGMTHGVYNEKLLNKVPRTGGYSSFDDDKFQDRGSQMKVLTRYKQLSPTHLEFVKTLKNYPEIIEFYIKHFNPDNNKLAFIDQVMNS